MRLLSRMTFAFAILLVSRLAPAAPLEVGEFGDPDQILFVGNQTFSSKQLRSALEFDVELLQAGHPEAPLNDFLAQLERRVRDGYLNSGFAHATASARFEDDRGAIVVTIQEGRRFQCGGIETTGAVTLPVEQFQNLLISPQADTPAEQASRQPSKKPLWRIGKPATFSDGAWTSRRDAFQRAFQALGYFDPSYSVHCRPEEDGTATLVVAIQDEGPRAVLGDIEVIGAAKNSIADVVRFLDLPPGTVLDSHTKRRIEHQLRDSARFIRHDVEVVTPPLGNERSILRITLLEYAAAPPLFQPLSPEEEVMVKLCRWLNSLESTSEDFDLELAGPLAKIDPEAAPQAGAWMVQLRMVISHCEQACMFHARLMEYPDREAAEVWVHLTPQRATIDFPRQSVRYSIRNLRQSVTGTIQWTASPPDAEGRMSNLLFGMGVTGDSAGVRPPFVLQALAAPVAALREAHTRRESLNLHEGQLTISTPDCQLAVAAETGRLLRCQFRQGHGRFAVHCDQGRYRKLLEEYERQTAGVREIASADAPISNLLSALASSVPERLLGTNELPSRVVTSLAHSLLKRGAFRAFDDLLLDWMDQPADPFRLPPADAQDRPAAVNGGWAAYVLPAARRLAPRPSWAWTLCREFAFAKTRPSPRTRQAIQQMLADPQTGPVSNAAAAWLMGLLHPQLRIAFARHGLTRLQRERFEQEIEPFLRDGSPVGRLLLATAQTLQDLEPQEIETLVQQLPLDAGERRSLARVLEMFPRQRSERPLDALREALGEAWEPLIEPPVRHLLESMAN